MKQGLLLWDVDGTLIKSNSKCELGPHARALFGEFAESIGQKFQKRSGQTDWQLIENLSIAFNLASSSQLLEIAFKNLDTIYKHDLETNLQIVSLPGLNFAFFEKLRSEWVLGVLTGNTQFRMIAKLSAVNLYSCFEKKFMYFCLPYETREDIMNRFLTEIQSQRFERIVVVGDTPYDIKIAKESNLECVSVCTGDYNMEELSLFSPNLLISDFQREEIAFREYLNR
jgi:phosphoglycolate phosphatase